MGISLSLSVENAFSKCNYSKNRFFWGGYLPYLSILGGKNTVLNQIRDKLQFLINGPARLAIKLHITPNQISTIAFVISSIAAISLAFPDYLLRNYVIVSPQFYFWFGWIPLAIFGLGSYLDAIDGTVARETGKATNYGAFLDSTLDRASDAIILLGIILGGMIWPWSSRLNALIGFFALIVVMLISYVRSRAEIEGVCMKGKGFMERAERVLFIVAIIIIDWVAFAVQTQYFGGWTLQWLFPVGFVIFTLLCLQTLWVRFSWTYKWLNNKLPASTIARYQQISSGITPEEK